MRWAGLFVVASLVAGCGPQLPPATPADAERTHMKLADLQAGRQLVLSKCGACHHVPTPGDHPASEWPHFVNDMAVRSHLDANEHHLIEAYLVTMATPAPSKPDAY